MERKEEKETNNRGERGHYSFETPRRLASMQTAGRETKHDVGRSAQLGIRDNGRSSARNNNGDAIHTHELVRFHEPQTGSLSTRAAEPGPVTGDFCLTGSPGAGVTLLE